MYASAGANPSAHASLALRPGICSPALPAREAPLASRPRSSAGGQNPRLTASFERAMPLGRLPPRSIDGRPASRRFAAAQAKKTGAPRRQMSASGALNSRYVRMVSSGRALGNGPVQRRKMVPKVGFEPTPPLRDRILSGAVARAGKSALDFVVLCCPKRSRQGSANVPLCSLFVVQHGQ